MALAATMAAQATVLPGWWTALHRMSRMEATFIQESESAVFGKLTKEGTLQLGHGGRFRVSYTKGIVLVSDGIQLIQYDPATRTAQRMDLRTATREMPLLNVLVDPASIESFYTVRGDGESRVTLEPKRKELPKVMIEGSGTFLRRIAWTDPTGAQQTLDLKQPRSPKRDFPPATFIFTAPAGTRWIQ
jgi:outer membrane lipoprotein-sorting protein